MTQLVNFLSLNVGSSATLAGLNMTISLMRFDVILLQEVKSSQLSVDSLVNRAGYSSLVNIDFEDINKPGTAIIWRKNFPLINAANLVTCRLQVAEIGPFKIFNCYAPSGSENKFERNQFYGEEIFKYLRLHSDSLKLIAGDHNSVIRKEDVEYGAGFSSKFCEALNTLVKCEHLTDCYQHLHPRSQGFTFHRPGKAKSRLDRFYVSDTVAHEIVAVEHVPSLSDHLGVKLIIRLDVSKSKVSSNKDFSFWKLNNQILEDDEFLPSFKNLWSHLSNFENGFDDVADWWDELVKPQIKDFCIGFSSYRKDKRNQTKQMLMSSLKIMMENSDWEEVIRIRELINIMLHEDLTGFKVRSKFHQGAETERSSLFHAAREHKNHQSVSNGIRVGGQVVTAKEDVENEVVHFFNALFNGHHGSDLEDKGTPFVPDWSNLDSLLQGVGEISDSESAQLVLDIRHDEMDLVVKECANMKSPGMDGLTYEFYKKVWGVIGSKFVEVLQVQLNRCKLITSDTMGATKLIPKVDGIPKVEELRPITLLNTDYKLLTKWIVLRLRPLMGKIIKSG